MTSPKDYVDNVNQALEVKKASLDALLSKYNALIRLDDTQFKVDSSNGRVLGTNHVYNSQDIDPKLKETIKTRQLLGLTQEEVDNLYKQVLYGIVPKEPLRTPFIDRTIQEKVIPQVDYDRIPNEIDATTASEAGHSQAYLLSKAKEHGLTLRDLKELIELKGMYKTNFPTMLNFIAKGGKVQELGELLEVRKSVSDLTGLPRVRDTELVTSYEEVPLDLILEFYKEVYQKFLHTGKQIDAEYIANTILDIHGGLGHQKIAQTLIKVVDLAQKKSDHLENLLKELEVH